MSKLAATHPAVGKNAAEATWKKMALPEPGTGLSKL
jgi:hypothetical protein